MTTPNLAKIERVDLREAWPNEALDFTPWLAKNIAELGEALGLSLELREAESSVGDFSLDILAIDNDENRPVIIENQLEATNHGHLGQLLTYAANSNGSVVVVWLAREFRDEHRQALDWLNQRTGEDTQFFGVVVELWRIGDSLLAPHFKTVATPNEWLKAQIRPASTTVRDEQNYKWRRGLLDKLRKQHGFSSSRMVEAKGRYLTIDRPISDVRFDARWRTGSPGFAMIIQRRGLDGREWNQRLFEFLERRRSDIEAGLTDCGLDERFVWEPVRTQRSRITIYRDGNVLEEPERCDEFQDWITKKLYKFRDVLTPYLKDFDAQEQLTSE